MSDTERFLERWSRLKREMPAIPEQEHTKSKADSAQTVATSGVTENGNNATDHNAEPTNLPDLPAVDSISATTNIRVFLQAGVPDELKHAALRRAWVSDPQIRDFVGLAENDWDFNDPNGIHGFGALPAGEDVARLLSRVVGEPASPQEPTPKDENVQLSTPKDENVQLSSLNKQSLPHPQSGAASAASSVDACAASRESENNTAQRSSSDDAGQNNSPNAEADERRSPRRHGSALPK